MNKVLPQASPEIRPATDEEIANTGWACTCSQYKTGHTVWCAFNRRAGIEARIEADRARIRQLEAERESNNRAFVEMNAVFEAVMRAIRGEALSEFDESYGAVYEAKALRAAAQERDRQIAVLEQERDDDTAWGRPQARGRLPPPHSAGGLVTHWKGFLPRAIWFSFGWWTGWLFNRWLHS
jgi:hypothetical protein